MSTQDAQPVHQFRKRGTAPWWDGYPDNEDGGGPYETRTLYKSAALAAQQAAEPVRKKQKVTLDLSTEPEHAARIVWSEWSEWRPELNELNLCVSIDNLPSKGPAVGVAEPMPGTPAFTMACFAADKVPAGTKLYTHAPATPQSTPAKPLFAASVAARKWADLQEQGARMQHIAFDGGTKGPGTIDPWGKVMWGDAATPQAEPVADAEVRDARYWLEAIIDILKDEGKAPEHRCYVDGAFRDAISEAQAMLATTPPPVQPRDLPAATPADMRVYDQIAGNYMQAVQPQGELSERAAFEAFAQHCPMGKYSIARRKHGYDSSHTQIMWDAWQGAWAQAWSKANGHASQVLESALASRAVQPMSDGLPDQPGIYAWVAGNAASLVLVNKRPSEHAPGGQFNGHIIQSTRFYDGCAVADWGRDGKWTLLHAHGITQPQPKQEGSN